MIGKAVEVTELLQNKNFLYFLQVLIEKEQQGSSKVS